MQRQAGGGGLSAALRCLQRAQNNQRARGHPASRPARTSTPCLGARLPAPGSPPMLPLPF